MQNLIEYDYMKILNIELCVCYEVLVVQPFFLVLYTFLVLLSATGGL